MKILRVCSDLYPYVVGGIGIHAHEMSKLQTEMGHDVMVLTAKPKKMPVQTIPTNYRISFFNSYLKIFGNTIDLFLFFKLWKIRYDYDIIHAHSHLFFPTLICALIRKIGSPPFVITTHGLIGQTAPMWLNKIYMPTIASLIFRSADKIISYTTVEKMQLVDLGIPAEKIDVIHNGIDAQIFCPSSKIATNQILWIGRFAPGKGVEYLISAFTIIAKQYPELSLVMIGEGSGKKRIEQLIQNLGLINQIIIKEFIPNSDLPQFYQDSMIYVLPSLEEGVPRTILEAMACEIPIVCTDLPQLVDIVKGSGILVQARDSPALANAITEILSNPELAKKFGECGRNRVCAEYSWEDSVKKTLQIYEELVYMESHKT